MKHIRSTFGIISLFALALPFVASAATCVPLARTLKIGMKGEDVRVLQRVLNGTPSTVIAVSGPGSVGNETTFFGGATEKAVRQYQSLHAPEVLIPAGINAPTGVVGKFTRDTLNKLVCAYGNTVVSSPSATAAKQAADNAAQRQKLDDAVTSLLQRLAPSAALERIAAGLTSSSSIVTTTPFSVATNTAMLPVSGTAGKYPLQLFTLTPLVVTRGSNINVMGTGFSPTTHLRIGANSYPLSGGSVSDTGTFKIPSDLALGNYTVTLEDGGMKSNERALVVAADLGHQPTITSLTPDTGNIGTSITIKGTNFASTNDIVTSLGTIHNISSSDGSTITFTLMVDSTLLNRDGKILPYLPFSLGVININGASGFNDFKIR